MGKKYNFYAGPAVLPDAVLEQLEGDIRDYRGTGLSLIETSHRSKEYDAVHSDTLSRFRTLFSVPESHEILFLGGGATMQFGMVPLNFLAGGSADFTLTGAWAKKAIADAKKVGEAEVLYDGSSTGFTTLPDPSTITPSPDARYLHITSNETIEGLQWKEFPSAGDVPIVCDMSSDILSRPVDLAPFGLIYAGAQKNLGPAGVTVVIIRKDMMEREPANLPAYLKYSTHAEKKSLYNTPPVFSIWAMSLVLEWIEKQGGLPAITEKNERKAAHLYGVLDKLSDFYKTPVAPDCRSTMNVVFRTPSEELDKRLVEEATSQGLLGLKGHRSVGGCRASIYNAMPFEGVETLTSLLEEFARKNG